MFTGWNASALWKAVAQETIECVCQRFFLFFLLIFFEVSSLRAVHKTSLDLGRDARTSEVTRWDHSVSVFSLQSVTLTKCLVNFSQNLSGIKKYQLLFAIFKMSWSLWRGGGTGNGGWSGVYPSSLDESKDTTSPSQDTCKDNVSVQWEEKRVTIIQEWEEHASVWRLDKNSGSGTLPQHRTRLLLYKIPREIQQTWHL